MTLSLESAVASAAATYIRIHIHTCTQTHTFTKVYHRDTRRRRESEINTSEMASYTERRESHKSVNEKIDI